MFRAIHGTAEIAAHPGAFALRVLKGFRANQGLLLAGAVAYYALLSLVPLLILVVIALSRFVDESRLLVTLGQYLEFIVPAQSGALVEEVRLFIANGQSIGPLLLVTMVFFSAMAFTVLENAMSVIFYHRVAVRRRRFLVSAAMPYLFMVCLALGFLVVTVVAGSLAALATRDIVIFGELRSLDKLSASLLYLLGVAGEVLVLSAIYLVMPVGRLSWRHALLGGATATILWEITRHLIVWYFTTISQIRVVYGSLTTAIAVLLSVEIAGIVLLLGAQVIAEYERLTREPLSAPARPLKTSRATP